MQKRKSKVRPPLTAPEHYRKANEAEFLAHGFGMTARQAATLIDGPGPAAKALAAEVLAREQTAEKVNGPVPSQPEPNPFDKDAHMHKPVVLRKNDRLGSG